MTAGDGGCDDPWCMQIRGGFARRADLAEHALRAQNKVVYGLQIDIARLTRGTDEQERVTKEYHEFRAKAWVLFALILMVIGGALISVVLLGEHLISTTTFNEVRR